MSNYKSLRTYMLWDTERSINCNNNNNNNIREKQDGTFSAIWKVVGTSVIGGLDKAVNASCISCQQFRAQPASAFPHAMEGVGVVGF